MISIGTVEDAEGFRALRDEWNELLGASEGDCLFLTWEWLYTWWRHLADGRKLCIITVRYEQQLIAIAPLATRPRRFLHLLPFRVLEFLGSGNVGSDYLNFLVRRGFEQKALPVLAGCLTQRNLVLQLSQIERVASQMVNVALQLQQLAWRTHRTTIDFCPYIKLEGLSWESYLAGLGRSHRANLRRRQRKLYACFQVRMERIDTEVDRHQALEILTNLHLRRWSGRGGSDALHRAELCNFHEEFTAIALRRGWLRLYVLRLDDRPVAALYGLLYHGNFLYYQAGFDTNYSEYSVGMVMMGLVIKSAIEEGAREFDFLHGEESYKYLWAKEERELVRFDLFPPHLGGFICRQVLRVRTGMKRLVSHWLPAGT